MKKIIIESCGYCQEFWHCPVMIELGGIVQNEIPKNCPLPDDHSEIIAEMQFNPERYAKGNHITNKKMR